MKIWLKIISLLICFKSFSLVFEDNPGEVSLKFVSKVDLIVNGNKAVGEVLFSHNSVKDILDYYKKELTEGKYEEIKTATVKDKLTYISFKRGIKSGNIQVLTEKEGNAIIKYEIEEKIKNFAEKNKHRRKLNDIPEPLSSVRELCIERISGEERSITLVYKTRELKHSIEKFYMEKMKTIGWKCIQGISKEAGDNQLIFTKAKEWCSIGVSEDYVIIICYYSRRKE